MDMQVLRWRYQRFHSSYLLGWLCAGAITGLALGKIVSIPYSSFTVYGVLLLVMLMLFKRRWWSIVIIVMCGMVMGIWKGSYTIAQLASYQDVIGMSVVATGVVSDDPQSGDRHQTKFYLTHVTINGESLIGNISGSTYDKITFKRGDTIRLSGTARSGFGTYQVNIPSAKVTAVSASNDVVRDARDAFSQKVRGAMDETAASLGIGFVVGQRSALPEDLDDQLKVVGLTHIVVASGYNLTILVRFARRLLEKHSKYVATVVSGGLMIGFVAVSGLSPSMTRASVVTGLSLLAWYYGRRFHPLLLIVYVASGTAFLSPIYLWADLGWYLSFLAFAGVLILAPLLSKYIFRNSEPSAIMQLIVETTAAQIMTLPLILAVFGTLPVLSIVANALVAPVIPAAMLIVTLTGIIAFIAPAIAGLLALLGNILLGYILGIVKLLASPEWSQIMISISIPVMILCYVAIMCAALMIWQRLKFNFRKTSIVE